MRTKRWLVVLLLAAGIPLSGCEILDDDDDDVTPPPSNGDGNGNGDPSSGTISPVVNTSTTAANDLRGLTYADDGSIYASGHAGTDDALLETVVARFNADGTPDTTFADDGFAQVDVAPSRAEESLGVAELANGDVVALVNAVDADGGQSVYLLRFDSSGTQLTSPDWGDEQGRVEVVFGWANADNDSYPGSPAPEDEAWDIEVDSGAGERLVIFGIGSAPEGSDRTDNDRYVVRLDASDGSVDQAFNDGEPFSYHSTGTLGDNARRGLVEDDGSIVSAGYTNFGDGIRHHVILIRLTPSGELDTSFGDFIEPAETGNDVGISAEPGIAVFNPFRVDGGYTEAYAVARQSSGSYVTTGYGGATAAGEPSTLDYETTVAQDVVSFRVAAAGTATDTAWGNNGTQAIQSESQGRPTNEDRGRHLAVLDDDRTVHVGRYGGNAAIYVLTADGELDTDEGENGIFELGHPDIGSQFYNVAVSSDGTRVATTTNEDSDGARLVVLEVDDSGA